MLFILDLHKSARMAADDRNEIADTAGPRE